ncbi:MAG: 8-oxo-dGTP diphosphatase [Candidatus Roizmanbacteria bacterium]
MDDQVLLGLKKRGFGVGKFNGIGGKVNPDELVEAAVIRECEEEIGITPLDISQSAIIRFYQALRKDVYQDAEVHVYVCTKWRGEPKESEEMKPQWFPVADLPSDQMWDDDQYWLPRVLAGEQLRGEFWFDHQEKVIRQKLDRVS